MAHDFEVVRTWFDIAVTESLRGAQLSGAGLADGWLALHQSGPDQELLHFELTVAYRGDQSQTSSWQQVTLEDCEGYMLDPVAPDDALDDTLTAGESVRGGVMFHVYRDVEPIRLWFDTGQTYPGTESPMLIDVAIGEPGRVCRPETWKEQAASNYDREFVERELHGGKMLPLFETRELMECISRKLGLPYRRLANGYLFQLILDGGRQQNVLMSFSGQDEEGCDLIRFLTICAPADDCVGNHDLFLRMNPRLCYGSIGILPIGQQDFYVLVNTQLAATADQEELIKSITHLGRVGDELEERLTGGQDIR